MKLNIKDKSKFAPVISIGIIFKNEIRCIERCLKSFEPLKDIIPCEIVMADTGSSDGSREVAEKYADMVFDFPWIDDFSAARNAVMDRCKGKWYFSVDCDEWLGGDIASLAIFAMQRQKNKLAALNIRNYQSKDIEHSEYVDFTGLRLVLLSTGWRYWKPIHECFNIPDGSVTTMLSGVYLNHDGYVAEYWGASKKEERNMNLLMKEVESKPDNLLLRLQCVESSTVARMENTRNALDVLKKKPAGWEMYGAAIIRYAVISAMEQNLPEYDEWLKWAEEWYPDSMFIRLDVNCAAMNACFRDDDYAGCLERGIKYMEALKQFDAKQYNMLHTACSIIMCATPTRRRFSGFCIAESGIKEKQYDKSLEALALIKGALLNKSQAAQLAQFLMEIQSHSDLDIGEEAQRLWAEIKSPEPTEQKSEERKKAFLHKASEAFRPKRIKEEEEGPDITRPAYTAFQFLKGEDPRGDAAAFAALTDKSAMEQALADLDLNKTPIMALEHALRNNVHFPPRGKKLTIEEQDRLASRLAKTSPYLPQLVDEAVKGATDAYGLFWARAMLLAAVQVQDWEEENDGLWTLCQDFSRIEGKFINMCYQKRMLSDDYITLIPPMHRFGWLCSQAFEAFERNNILRFIKLLHKALELNPEMKGMVSFMLSEVKRGQHKNKIASAPPELVMLAEKVRGILSAYDPGDPALESLKSSPLYQKVAWLIEDKVQSCKALTN